VSLVSLLVLLRLLQAAAAEAATRARVGGKTVGGEPAFACGPGCCVCVCAFDGAKEKKRQSQANRQSKKEPVEIDFKASRWKILDLSKALP
jgi:hypothetical protein